MSNIHVYACGSDELKIDEFQNYYSVETKGIHEISYFKDHPLSGVKSLSAGMSYSALIDSNGVLYTWGQLNLQKNTKETFRHEPKIATYFTSKNINLKQVSTMNEHAAAVSEDGNVFIWGNNSLHHFPFPFPLQKDNHQNEDVLIDNPSRINLDIKACSISCGGYFTMILSKDGCIWISGINNENDLGFDSHSSMSSQTKVQNPEPLSMSSFHNKKIIQIAAGWSHAEALADDGSVYTWGKSSTGRLGRNPLKRIDFIHFDQNFQRFKIKFITCGHNDTYAIDENGRMYGSGWNEGGQHGSGNQKAKRLMKLLNNEENVKFCSTSSDHSIIILENGSIKVAGSNENGKIGLNIYQYPLVTSFIPILSNQKGIAIATGYKHSLFITTLRNE